MAAFTELLATPTMPAAKRASPDDVHAPAANAAAAVTYAGVAGRTHCISGVAVSYDDTPTGGNLKVEDGAGNVIFSVDIAAAGPDAFYFAPPKRGTVGAAMTVTLAAGGEGVSGKVSVLSHWVE